MGQFLKTTLHPSQYHGHGKKPPFFEGWYFKLVSADEAHRLAVIPGVLLGPNGHAFVQVLDGIAGTSSYHTFPLDDFWASDDEFQVRIGPNRFEADHISLDLDDAQGKLRGELHFEGITPWPVTLLSPGIMGWYAWVPRMECYHGVVSLDHAIQGALEIDGKAVDFSGGRGYIEKDWGQSFPAAWVWFQSNHFQQPGTSITASIAIIPWLGTAFPGHIVGLWRDKTLYRFATYTGSRVEKLEIADSQVTWVLRDSRHRLEMTAQQAEGGLILGPMHLEMGKRVAETLRANVSVRMSTLKGQVLFSGEGRDAGLEVNGDVDRLVHSLGARH